MKNGRGQLEVLLPVRLHAEHREPGACTGRYPRQGAALTAAAGWAGGLLGRVTEVVSRATEVPPHGEGIRHDHPHAAEVWLFFAGRGRAIVGDREYPTGPDTVVYTPPGTFHQFVNTGDEPVKLYFLYVPAGEAQPSSTPNSVRVRRPRHEVLKIVLDLKGSASTPV